jgi:hypothetical protein
MMTEAQTKIGERGETREEDREKIGEQNKSQKIHSKQETVNSEQQKANGDPASDYRSPLPAKTEKDSGKPKISTDNDQESPLPNVIPACDIEPIASETVVKGKPIVISPKCEAGNLQHIGESEVSQGERGERSFHCAQIRQSTNLGRRADNPI